MLLLLFTALSVLTRTLVKRPHAIITDFFPEISHLLLGQLLSLELHFNVHWKVNVLIFIHSVLIFLK